jgi:catechol 2,3-dioxygenase-like lactoylglutathione lyase family enzyme
MMRDDNAADTEMTVSDNSVRHIHHHAYACWDSEENRHFYEDILGMPLVATIVLEDPLRMDGSRYCHTFFEISDGIVLAFFEHTSLFHPKAFTARSGFSSQRRARSGRRCDGAAVQAQAGCGRRDERAPGSRSVSFSALQ